MAGEVSEMIRRRYLDTDDEPAEEYSVGQLHLKMLAANRDYDVYLANLRCRSTAAGAGVPATRPTFSPGKVAYTGLERTRTYKVWNSSRLP
ncbi:hypothetical protein ABI214_17720 [Prescottella soli]|uniref:Uncharacterized protein n=1 Tax=Prescottella soli TaxID=1543852 RepID=A0ABW9G1E7_9NOCA